MSAGLQNPFLKTPLQCDTRGGKNGSFAYFKSLHPPKRYLKKCRCAGKNEWLSRGIKFTQLCSKRVDLLRKNIGLQSACVVNSIKEPLTQGKMLVKSLSPVWEEGLLLVRCSVFCAVISGVCLLVWYGQLKAKSYIETKLLPSVCSLLSDHIQRKIDFGRVRSISPLSITLESCSIGPHREEFSCGEVPSIKLRILPFASLSRGKIVIDAVLSNPTLLVAQKKDYTWLGIPFTEGTLQRHLSSEEGIDYRTKTRRIAREEAGARWVRERDDSAMQAAEMGYIVPEGTNGLSEDDYLKENTSPPMRVFFMDERLHWRDHHCMDAGLEYDLKHADLEKSFGAKVSQSGTKFWSRIVPGPIRQRLKRKANGKDLLADSVTAKRRILEHSASAARAYFRSVSYGGFSSPPHSSELLELDIPKSEGDSIASISTDTFSDKDLTIKQNSKSKDNPENRFEEVAEGTLQPDNNFNLNEQNSEMGLESHGNSVSLNTFSFMRDPVLFTLSKLNKTRKYNEKFSSISRFIRPTEIYGIKHEDSEGDDVGKGVGDSRKELSSLSEQDVKNDASHIQGGHVTSNSVPMTFQPPVLKYHSDSLLPLSLKLMLPSFLRKMGEPWSNLLAGPVEMLKSDMGPGVEDMVSELTDGEDHDCASTIENKVPFILDSVHYRGGTLMLLAYGDTEPR